ncbi:MAG: type IV toxin-antitoxin system AbiEi family antitoxin domain-containing protein [Thermodesulfobacteriota bacterium]
MKYAELLDIKKTFFSSADVAESLEIKPQSAVVLCNRYVKSGLLIRLKRDLYMFAAKWPYLNSADFFRIANRLQVPSYLSLTTALSFYEMTTQVQQAYFESISLKQNEYNVQGVIFRYFKVKPVLYFGFVRREGIFIATPEKALWDAVYLQSLGRYSLDVAALDLKKINKATVEGLAERFPERARRYMENLWKA